MKQPAECLFRFVLQEEIAQSTSTIATWCQWSEVLAMAKHHLFNILDQILHNFNQCNGKPPISCTWDGSTCNSKISKAFLGILPKHQLRIIGSFQYAKCSDLKEFLSGLAVA